MKPREFRPNAKEYCWGELVDALQHEGGAAEVGEEGGVGEARDEHGAEEHPVGEQAPEVAGHVRQLAGDAVFRGSVSRKMSIEATRIATPTAARNRNSPASR
jgi:hypothetical protein